MEKEKLRGQPANPGSPGKTAVKTECKRTASDHSLKASSLTPVCIELTGESGVELRMMVTVYIITGAICCHVCC